MTHLRKLPPGKGHCAWTAAHSKIYDLLMGSCWCSYGASRSLQLSMLCHSVSFCCVILQWVLGKLQLLQQLMQLYDRAQLQHTDSAESFHAMFSLSCRCYCAVLCLAALSVCTTAHNFSASSEVDGLAASTLAPQLPALPGKGMQRFLAVPMPGSKSHYLQLAAIVKELASRGHHVKVWHCGADPIACACT